MTKIDIGALIGWTHELKAEIDLDVLLRTRLLVQASSGGGKSWLLRRLAEQLFGKAQVILIDPEGEFATLRERYGYVLVGKGGETPADRRSAALLAHKLLQLRASAVCDLYEMRPHERHSWVRLFLESLIDAPKQLWHHLVVIVDEAHVFAPEKGAGESEASSAMIDLATRGRKRGFCAVFATQRLGKLRKDAAAELLNVLIGQTFIDVDRERAADALGIAKGRAAHQFYNELRLLKPGRFWGLGRAISTERVLVEVGPVDTTHPSMGSTKHAAEPPPAPEAVKAMLPKLADLPAAAEEKAKTETELRSEIRSLKGKLAARPTVEVPQVEIERVEVPILKDAQVARLETVTGRLEKTGTALVEVARELAAALRNGHGRAAAAEEVIRQHERAAAAPLPRRAIAAAVPVPRRQRAAAEPVDGGLSGPEQRILDALAWLESVGNNHPEQTAVAFLAGYRVGGGAYNNPRGRLHTKGLVEYGGGRLKLTEEGRALANAPDEDLSAAAIQERVLEHLDGPEQRILRVLLDAYPKPVANDDLARAAGYEPGGGAYNNPRGRLRTLGLIYSPDRGLHQASPALFLEGR